LTTLDRSSPINSFPFPNTPFLSRQFDFSQLKTRTVKMDNILERLNAIERKLDELAALNKETLNFTEAARYLNLSKSHLYKLTSGKQIPHYKPRGKQVFFERKELDKWLLQNRQTTKAEIEQAANDYVMKGGKR
jgi:excisionase family DNA binding protein